MANEGNNSEYHGYRYLFDAENTRQYAIRWEGGKAQKPVHVFAPDSRDASFKPNEIVFAFDDEVEKGVNAAGRPTVSVTVSQIKTGADAELKGLKLVGIDYDVSFALNGDIFNVTYKMTQASRELLLERDFDTSFVRRIGEFSEQVDARDPGLTRSGGRIAIHPDFMANLAFPPHQFDGSAQLARMNMELAPPQLPSTEPNSSMDTAMTPRTQTPREPRVSQDFNTVSPRTQTQTPAKPYTVTDKQLEALFAKYCEDLSEQAQQGKLDPVVGRDEETNQAANILARRKQASLCFVGEAGVGKTAMFRAIAQKFNDDGTGERVLLLDLQAMNAGAKFRGQFEEKLKPLMDGLKEREGMMRGQDGKMHRVILAIDEIHSQLTAGKAEGGTDAGNMMKPFLTARGISTMGTTTLDEYRKHIEKDPALARRFKPVKLGEPANDAVMIIAKKIEPVYREFHGIETPLTEQQLQFLVTSTNRYAPNEKQPDKIETAIDTAMATAKRRHSKTVTQDDLVNSLTQMSKLPREFLMKNDSERFLQMKNDLPNKVLGQPGLTRITKRVIGARSGLNDPKQPWGAFLLQGPTGTGKTETAKAVSEYLGLELIKLDMSEYSEKHTVSRLIGAPPGYVGFDSAEPALTERIRQNPYCVLLLDEIEKAHPDVLNVLLGPLNDGKMDDNQGRVVPFNNVIVFFTSNLGAQEAMTFLENGGGGFGFGGKKTYDADATEKGLDAIYEKARKGHMRPEMINRIKRAGGIITFVPLSEDIVRNLADREIDKISQRLSDPAGVGLSGVTLEVSAELKDQLTKEGYSRTEGARPLQGVIQDRIGDPLGEWILANKENVATYAAQNGGAKLVINTLDEAVAPRIEPGASAPAAATTATTAVTGSNDNTETAAAQKKKKSPSFKP